MAFVKCEEIGHGRRRYQVSDNYNVAVDEAEVEIVRSWRLTGDEATDTGYGLVDDAQTAGALPRQWDELDPEVPDWRAATLATEETEFPEVHVASWTYKLIVDPLAEPAVWRYACGQQEVAIEEDVDEFAMLNSAGDPFDPPPTRPEPYLIMTAVKNMADVDANSIVNDYLHHVNSAAFRGLPIGQVYLADFSASQKYKYGVHYYETQWTFWARERTWQLRILDCGFRCWPGPPTLANVRYLIRGPDSAPVQSPALLDGTGRQLVPGGTPVFLTFTICDSVDFNALGIGGR